MNSFNVNQRSYNMYNQKSYFRENTPLSYPRNHKSIKSMNAKVLNLWQYFIKFLPDNLRLFEKYTRDKQLHVDNWGKYLKHEFLTFNVKPITIN